MTETKRLPDHVVSIHIDVPVQRVWDEITKTGRVQRALYNTVLEMDLVPGSRLRYYSPDRKRVFIVGEVVEVEPPRKLSHTYMFTTRLEPFTLVTWELVEEAGGCRSRSRTRAGRPSTRRRRRSPPAGGRSSDCSSRSSRREACR